MMILPIRYDVLPIKEDCLPASKLMDLQLHLQNTEDKKVNIVDVFCSTEKRLKELGI